MNLPGTLLLSLGSLDGIEPFTVALSETPLKLYLAVPDANHEELLVSIYTALRWGVQAIEDLRYRSLLGCPSGQR